MNSSLTPRSLNLMFSKSSIGFDQQIVVMSYGRKAPVIVGLAAGLALVVLFSIVFTSRLPFYPVYPISDVKLQENMEKTPEVKALYSKYQEVSVGFNRDDRIRTISFFGRTSVSPNGEGQSPQITYSMDLWVVAHMVTGKIQEMGLACTIADGSHDPIQNIFLENIEKEILSGDCLDVQLPATWLAPSEDYDTYPISIGNRDFEIGYSFASGLGKLESATVDVDTITIYLGVSMRDADTLAIKLENEMLKQLEIETDQHYCVGRVFVIFIDGESAAESSKYGNDELIIVSLRADTKLIEIIGGNLLITSRICP